jgi:hypothetical protein
MRLPSKSRASSTPLARRASGFGVRRPPPRQAWPQTEWTKASLILAELGDEGERIPL